MGGLENNRILALISNRRAIAAFVVVSVIIAYWANFTGELFIDDDALRGDFFDVWTDGGGLLRIWRGERLLIEDHYRPVADTVIWLAHQLPWDIALTLRLLNVVLHLAFVLIGWCVLEKLAVRGATWACVWFVLHPVCVQSVTWAIQVRGMLANLLAITVVWMAVNHHVTRQWRWALGAVVAMTLACLSKTTVVTTPFVMLALALGAGLRLRRNDYVLVAVLTAVGVLVATYGTSLGVKEHVVYDSLFARMADAAVRLMKYFRHAIDPFANDFYYSFDVSPADVVAVAIPIALLIGLLATRRYRQALLLVCVLAAFAASLAPIIVTRTITGMVTPVHDRYQYIGTFIIIAYAASRLVRIVPGERPRMRRALPVVAFLVAVVLAAMSARLVRRYAEPTRLLEHSARAAGMTDLQRVLTWISAVEVSTHDAETLRLYEHVAIQVQAMAAPDNAPDEAKGDEALQMDWTWILMRYANFRCMAGHAAACVSQVHSIRDWQNQPQLLLMLAHAHLEGADPSVRSVEKARQALDQIGEGELNFELATQRLFVMASLLAHEGSFDAAGHMLARLQMLLAAQRVPDELRRELAARAAAYGRRTVTTNSEAMRYWRRAFEYYYRYNWP